MDKHTFNLNKYRNYQITIASSINNTLNLSILEDPDFGKIIVSNSEQYSFNYYNGQLEKITVICEAVENYTITIKEHDLRINQIYMNDILKISMQDDILKAHNLVEYYDDSAPAIFYGLMSPNDLIVLEKHK